MVTVPELCGIVVSGGDAHLERDPIDEATASLVHRILGAIVQGPRPGRGRFRDELPLLVRDLAIDLREQAGPSHMQNEGLKEVASAWVIACCFVRALEERGVLPCRLAGPGAEEAQRNHGAKPGSVAAYLLQVLWSAQEHHAGEAVLQDASLWDAVPSDAGAMSLLEFFRSDVPGKPRWSFAGDPWTDLYESVNASVRSARGMVATPAFVGDLLLDPTLDRACAAIGAARVHVLDPACGSGLMLVRAFERLADHLRRTLPDEAPDVPIREALDRIHGADIEGIAVMLTRVRLVLATLDRAEVRRALPVHVVRADSLLAGRGGAGARDEASTVFGRRYEVVVSEPPWIQAEPALRRRYQSLYRSASARGSLAAPFMELSLGLAVQGGFVGLFMPDSFRVRAYGKGLVEEVLAKVELTDVLDTSGAYIPGHGTPTILLAARNRPSEASPVRVVTAKRGEPIAPLEPAKGEVWSRIVAHRHEAGYEDEYIAVWDAPHERLAKHPWSLSAGGARALEDALARASSHLHDVAESRRAVVASRLDGVLSLPPDVAGRLGIEREVLRPIVTGASIRGWTATSARVGIAPYEPVTGSPRAPEPAARWWRFLWKYRALLRARRAFGDRPIEPWWAWSEWPREVRAAMRVAHPAIGARTGAARVAENAVLGWTAHGVELKSSRSEDDLFALLGYLNSSVVSFWLKQVSFRRSPPGEHGQGVYDFAGPRFADLPIPEAVLSLGPLRAEIVRSARRLDGLARERAASSLDQALARWDRASRDSLLDAVSEAQAREQASLRAMVAAQEDLDWLIYDRLLAIFKPDSLGDLVRDGATQPSRLDLGAEDGTMRCSLSGDGAILSAVLAPWEVPGAVFLPSREVLAMSEGFPALYKDRDIQFDETYNDLCLALDKRTLRDAPKAAASFYGMLGGDVERRGSRFYVDIGDGFHVAHVVADGMRKIATLAYLVGNGSIRAGRVLLWDEPEANLNPRFIAKLAVALRELAAQGVQIFVATHDFLVSHKLSLAAEYGTEPKVPMRFFSLHRSSPAEPVQVEEAATLVDIRNNAILDEYAGHYDEERALFRDEVDRGPGGAR